MIPMDLSTTKEFITSSFNIILVLQFGDRCTGGTPPARISCIGRNSQSRFIPIVSVIFSLEARYWIRIILPASPRMEKLLSLRYSLIMILPEKKNEKVIINTRELPIASTMEGVGR